MKNFISNYGLSILALIMMVLCTSFGVYDFLTPDGFMGMATAGVVSVKNIRLYKDVATVFTAYGCAQSASFSRSREMVSTTCKDSGDDEEVIPGVKSGSMSMTNFFAFDHILGLEEIRDDFEAGTLLTMRYGGVEVGDFYEEVDCYIESYDRNSDGTSGPATYSVNLKMTGPVTKGVNV